MATIIEKVRAGVDPVKSQEDFAAAVVAADPNAVSKEYLDAREARANAEAEMNLTTNALIFPLPGETIATRVVVVSDEEAAAAVDGSRDVEADAFINAVVEASQPNVVPHVAEGELEKEVDAPKASKPPTPQGGAQTSHATSSSIAGSGVDPTKESRF